MERVNKGHSLISFPSEYVCIDVETTGLSYDYDEIIEVSAAIVESGQIRDKFSSLVQPKYSHAGLSFRDVQELGYSSFTDVGEETFLRFCKTHLIPQFITDLTGITNEMLLAAPLPEDVFNPFYEFIGDRIVLGHSVNFDVCFLYDAFSKFGHSFSNDYIDTMRISRKLFPDLPHHRLMDIVQHLNVEQERQHRAECDVLATIQCYEKMKLIIAEGVGFDSFINSFKRDYSYRNNILSGIVPPAGEIDETNPLYQKVVVFTGALSRMSRKEALQLVSDMGGIPSDSITKKTNFLVVGNEEFVSSVKDGKTNKMKKADVYQSKGADIMTIPEDTFFDMISQ